MDQSWPKSWSPVGGCWEFAGHYPSLSRQRGSYIRSLSIIVMDSDHYIYISLCFIRGNPEIRLRGHQLFFWQRTLWSSFCSPSRCLYRKQPTKPIHPGLQPRGIVVLVMAKPNLGHCKTLKDGSRSFIGALKAGALSFAPEAPSAEEQYLDTRNKDPPAHTVQ